MRFFPVLTHLFLETLTVSRSEFTDDTVTLVAGLERVKFVIHRHLVPWTITENMSSMQAAIVEEILIPNQHPDTIGMMVNWCYRKTVPSVLPHLLANPYSVEEVPDIPNLLPLRQLDEESDQDGSYVQHQVLTECLGGNVTAGATRDVSFEEFRLMKYNEMVDPAIRRSQATYQNTEEMEEAEDTLLEVEGPSEKAIRDAMTKYLQDEGVPVFEASEGRVEAEILQIKLVRLAMLATKYRWKRLLDDTLLAYAKGKTLFARRFPIPRHIELAYSVNRGLPRLRIFMANYAAVLTKEYKTDVELLSLHGRCPGFFRDNMMRHTRSPPSRLSDPITISHYEVCPE